MRVILYGYGKDLKREHEYLGDYDVIAVADRRVPEYLSGTCPEFSCPYISPEELSNYSYDYIAITSVSLFEPMKQQLICENHISQDKIVSMMLLLEKYKAKEYDADSEYYKNLFKSNVALFSHIPSSLEKEYLKDNGLSRRVIMPFYDLYLEEQAPEVSDKSFPMYVITHKHYDFLKVQQYEPITVGKYSHAGWISDSEGDNISYLNNRINELTAVYWVWKNRVSDYVGFCHYRRFFCNNEMACFENPLEMGRAERYLDDSDIIVHERSFMEDRTILEELKMPLTQKAYEHGLRLIKENITRFQPEYILDIEEVLSGITLCYYNMFVTNWSTFNNYCSWLFSFLIPAAEAFPVDQYEGSDRRVIGFFAERMLSVWLRHNHLKKQNLPVYIT